MKRLCLLFLIVLMTLALCGCGEKDENAGLYHCVEVRSGEEPLDLADSVLNLDQGGYGELTIRGELGAIRWTREGSELRVDVNGQVLAGTIENGLVSLEIPDNITLIYAREDRAESYLAERAAKREQQALLQAEWNGDWYGWWRIENAEGELADTWYDLCARVQPQADGRLYLTLWDEDQSLTEPMGELMLRVDEGETAQAVDGYFWLAGPEEMAFTLTDGQLCAAGHCEGGGESFDYTLCLRRWGERWNEDTERPYYYDDWYLPLIRAGREMPDAMDIRKQTNH